MFFIPYLSLATLWLCLAVTGEPESSGILGLKGTGARVGDYLFSAINLLVGIDLLSRFGKDPTARFLAVGMVGTASAFNLTAYDYAQQNGDLLAFAHILFLVVAAGAYLCGLMRLLVSRDGERLSGSRFSSWPMALPLVVLVVPISGLFYAISEGLKIPVSAFVFCLGVLMLGAGAVSQGYHAWLEPTRSDAEKQRQQSARILMAVLLLCFLLCSIAAAIYLFVNELLHLSNLRHPILALRAHPEFAFIVLSPLLTGLPIALFFVTRGGPERLLRSLEKFILSAGIIVSYVAIHVLFDFALKDRVVVGLRLEAQEILATALTTLLVVVLFDRAKETLTHHLHAWVFKQEKASRVLARAS